MSDQHPEVCACCGQQYGPCECLRPYCQSCGKCTNHCNCEATASLPRREARVSAGQRREAAHALRKHTCAGCGGKKQPGYIFCSPCWNSLPDAVRIDLTHMIKGRFVRGWVQALAFFQRIKSATNDVDKDESAA